MSKELTMADLDAQSIELLPDRAALGSFNTNWATVYASNAAYAVNAGSHWSHANATAMQWINVEQG